VLAVVFGAQRGWRSNVVTLIVDANQERALQVLPRSSRPQRAPGQARSVVGRFPAAGTRARQSGRASVQSTSHRLSQRPGAAGWRSRRGNAVVAMPAHASVGRAASDHYTEAWQAQRGSRSRRRGHGVLVARDDEPEYHAVELVDRQPATRTRRRRGSRARRARREHLESVLEVIHGLSLMTRAVARVGARGG